MLPPGVKIGVVQHACSADRNSNLEQALDGMQRAAAQGARIVCLQELFASLYFCQEHDERHFELAEALDGPTVSAVAKRCKELQVTTLTGIFERRAPGVYHNTLVIIGPDGQTRGVYRKMHIPDDPQFEEKYYFAPGDTGFLAVESQGVQLGPLICWDQWYPEAARLTAMQGAQVLFYPTAIGWLPEEKAEHGPAQLDAWKTMHRAHAIANGVFVVAANRVGTETSRAGSIEFWGHSIVCAPDGRVLAEASTEADVLVVDCDLASIENARRTWPFFRDRRVDAYQDLTRRWTR